VDLEHLVNQHLVSRLDRQASRLQGKVTNFYFSHIMSSNLQTAVKSQGETITSSAVCHDSKTKIDSTKFL
jgi:hypothetical protein